MVLGKEGPLFRFLIANTFSHLYSMSLQVQRKDRLAWENYTTQGKEAQWYEEGREYQKTIGIDDLDNR